MIDQFGCRSEGRPFECVKQEVERWRPRSSILSQGGILKCAQTLGRLAQMKMIDVLLCSTFTMRSSALFDPAASQFGMCRRTCRA
jgi:hypothetical protein